VTAQHPGHLLHWLEPRAHDPGAPAVEEDARPVGGDISPEALEVFLEEVRTYGAQVGTKQQLGQADLLLRGQILRPLEQQPTRAGEEGLKPRARSSLASFARTSSIALLRCEAMWKRSRTWIA